MMGGGMGPPMPPAMGGMMNSMGPGWGPDVMMGGKSALSRCLATIGMSFLC